MDSILGYREFPEGYGVLQAGGIGQMPMFFYKNFLVIIKQSADGLKIAMSSK